MVTTDVVTTDVVTTVTSHEKEGKKSLAIMMKNSSTINLPLKQTNGTIL